MNNVKISKKYFSWYRNNMVGRLHMISSHLYSLDERLFRQDEKEDLIKISNSIKDLINKMKENGNKCLVKTEEKDII